MVAASSRAARIMAARLAFNATCPADSVSCRRPHTGRERRTHACAGDGAIATAAWENRLLGGGQRTSLRILHSKVCVQCNPHERYVEGHRCTLHGDGGGPTSVSNDHVTVEEPSPQFRLQNSTVLLQFLAGACEAATRTYPPNISRR